ncbi:MAG: ATP-dependent Clp protease ATP-binding subunit ClpA [Gammaproteobacteria bacterium RIFCSPHIGHO2_12_FULL_41_15]|nr:MAG: ATP-dependent Clp protease ATP-binding subunit ClpA [Gammaproteobacteria bacterium RIFCSPHIGHO2_12_FULL_41_15]
MFSKSLENTLNSSFTLARDKRHEFITIEHLLLGLLDNPESSEVLRACGANIERLRAGLGIFIDETTPLVPQGIQRDIQPTLCFQNVLQRAIYQVQSSDQAEVSGAHVLSAIFGEEESQAVYFLNQENVTHMDVLNYISQGISKPYTNIEQQAFESGSGLEPSTRESNEESVIEQYTVNLNERARRGKIDPVIGREPELERTIQVLCRRTKNNPVFVGEAGVGKTAIAEALAQCIVDKEVPETLKNCTVYSLDLGVLVAGTKYRGDFEKRFKSVLRAMSKQSGAIVFIDEIHNLVGAGSATGGTMDASNLIKPLLSAGELRCMGATTYDEFRNFFAKDHALLRRFQRIDINEPSLEDTIKILKGLRSRFEDYHKIKYSDEALERAVILAEKHLHDRHMPDKAIDVIDEAGAHQHLLSKKDRKTCIGVYEIEVTVAKIARIPVQQLSRSDRQQLKLLPRQLKQVVFGQDEAIMHLSDAIKLSRAGLRDRNKPVGSFLLAGPTGVGKTEVTSQLSKVLGIGLIRFDMSEYMERHAVSRLIGAPPGYVGYDQGGLLTEAVSRQPHAVLLLDEIEKAHPDMFNILLQIMDYGKLTDNNGRQADFRHIILVMTTNAGADRLERASIGFANTDHEGDSMLAIKQAFSPEFRNRLDAVVEFKHLDYETIEKVVEKNLKELREQLIEKNVEFEITDAAKNWLAIHGYDKAMGARPMARLIQEKLKKPLADEMLFGKLTDAGKVRVDSDGIKLKVEVSEPAV